MESVSFYTFRFFKLRRNENKWHFHSKITGDGIQNMKEVKIKRNAFLLVEFAACNTHNDDHRQTKRLRSCFCSQLKRNYLV